MRELKRMDSFFFKGEVGAERWSKNPKAFQAWAPALCRGLVLGSHEILC